MTGNDTPPGVRLMTDGGHDSITKQTTVHAKAVVTREVDGEDIEMLRVPISSTRADREGDRFAKEALDGMAAQIKEQQPNVFLNHGLAGSWMEAIPYDVDKAKVGAQMDAEVVEADDGEYDLFAYVNPDGTHEYGAKLIPKVRDEKQPEKFSVGFGVNGYEPREEVEDDYEGDGRVFTSVDEMETSNVGIPANPDASATHAVAKSGASALPGYRMHPLFARLFAPDGTDAKTPITSETVQDATPVRVDGGKTDTEPASAAEVAALRGDINALREDVAELRDGDDEDKGPCDDNGDCPEGEECVDGECQPVDDDEDDSASATTEDLEALQAQLDNLKDALSEGRGESTSKDTETEEPDLTNGGEPDADADTEPDEQSGHEHITTR